MIAIRLTLLLIITNEVISEEFTNNGTKAVSLEPKNAFKFEGQSDTPQSYGLIKFEDQNNYGHKEYEDQNKYYTSENDDKNNEYHKYQNKLENNGQRIKFEEENRIENQRPNHPKKKRRRRKPKQIISNGVQSFQNGGIPGSFGRPGPVYPGPMYPVPYPPVYPGQMYKPRPSPTSAALSAVTEALTSIALYDDRQCVPRLLCEAAGGATGSGGGTTPGTASGLLQSITGLQPLLTLLAAYNGISSSPLFVFGRAVFLGMTSKANPGTCRYAYPDCPNDPEQLVYYLNNHNGGFFRFFAAPELNQQQGLEQFYNQLSGQNYGYYQPQQNQAGYGQLQQQNYHNQNLQQQGVYQNQNLYQGVYQNQNNLQLGVNQNLQQVGYGQLQLQNLHNQNLQQQNLYQNYPQVGYGQHLYPNNQNLQNFGPQGPNPYGNSYGFYGKGYPYQQKVNLNKFKNNEIQKRIQNSPNTEFVNNNVGNSKWLFPEGSFGNVKEEYNHVRIGKVLKFPGNNLNSVNAAEGFVFPGIQSNREYLISSIEAETDDFKFDGAMREKSYRNEDQYGYGIKSNNYDDNNNNNVRTLYIVRGNGDPNHPEIVHLAPGQTL